MVLEWPRLARQPVTPTATEKKLLSLPPYASGLNPVEYVWDELREKHFYNRVFDSLDALEDQLEVALRTFESNAPMVKSIVTLEMDCYCFIEL